MLVVPSALAVEKTPRELLMRMAENTRQLTYQGVFVYSQGPQMQTLQVFHSNKDGARRERLVHLTGEPREIVREGDKVLCYHAKNGLMRYDNTIPAGPFARDFEAYFAAENGPYSMSVIGQSRVAGRDATVLEITPSDHYRYGFRLALDQQSGLLLQSLMLNKRSQVLERIEYTHIEIGGTIAASDLGMSGHTEAAHDYEVVDMSEKSLGLIATEPAHSETSELSWKLNWLPPGFMASTSAKSNGSEQWQQNSMMYSDGLSAFSIFVSASEEMQNLYIHSGATLAYTQTNTDSQGSYSVTVVGEVPYETAKKIAAAVVR